MTTGIAHTVAPTKKGAKHTAEPWAYLATTAQDHKGLREYSIIQLYDTANTMVIAHKRVVGPLTNEMFANFSRVISCVNACKGMEDPKKEIAHLKLHAADRDDWAKVAWKAAHDRDDLIGTCGHTAQWMQNLIDFGCIEEGNLRTLGLPLHIKYLKNAIERAEQETP